MEFVAIKRSKGRRKRGNLKKRRREQIKLEVKVAKRGGFVSDRSNVYIAKEKLVANTMQAISFWENYTVAQEWQKRHSITWWKTRCTALEHENQVLREKLRSMVHRQSGNRHSDRERKRCKHENAEQHEGTSDERADHLEFYVNEDMMSFLEQSMRHKIEMRKKKEFESFARKEKEEEEDVSIQGGASWMQARDNNGKLLYGVASPTILAMETALQTTVDRHKDKARPQYWPIIPLKP